MANSLQKEKKLEQLLVLSLLDNELTFLKNSAISFIFAKGTEEKNVRSF